MHDLLYYFPYKYVDRSRIYAIREIDGNMPYIQLKGEIRGFELAGEGRGQRLVAHFTDGTGFVDLVWFQGIQYVTGKYKVRREYIVFASPQPITDASTFPIRISTRCPKYPFLRWGSNPITTRRNA